MGFGFASTHPSSIHYNRRKVYIRNVLTHTEYDRNNWKRKN
ncbi:type II toxin-antitoxin system HigB family toxin [Methylomonas sp. 2B]